MRRKLQLIDKFRRPSWLLGRDRCYFVLRVVDGRGTESKIYERRVNRQCFYRFQIGDFAFARDPSATRQLGQIEDDVF